MGKGARNREIRKIAAKTANPKKVARQMKKYAKRVGGRVDWNQRTP